MMAPQPRAASQPCTRRGTQPPIVHKSAPSEVRRPILAASLSSDITDKFELGEVLGRGAFAVTRACTRRGGGGGRHACKSILKRRLHDHGGDVRDEMQIMHHLKGWRREGWGPLAAPGTCGRGSFAPHAERLAGGRAGGRACRGLRTVCKGLRDGAGMGVRVCVRVCMCLCITAMDESALVGLNAQAYRCLWRWPRRHNGAAHARTHTHTHAHTRTHARTRTHTHTHTRTHTHTHTHAHAHAHTHLLRTPGHPHIVGLVDAAEDNAYVHLVMELCPGGDLVSRIVSKV